MYDQKPMEASIHLLLVQYDTNTDDQLNSALTITGFLSFEWQVYFNCIIIILPNHATIRVC